MRRLHLHLFILVLLVMAFTNCVRPRYFPEGSVYKGHASWYGSEFHGRPTSNKEIYNMNDLTAAHRTLPFGTYVIVTNLLNNKSVTVRINDRGPFVEGRDIDLSYAAAKILDMIGPGVVPVTIEVIRSLSPSPGSLVYSVQVGSFAKKSNATSLKQKLGSKYGNVYITEFKTQYQSFYRVRIKAKSKEEAGEIASRLERDGFPVIILEEQ